MNKFYDLVDENQYGYFELKKCYHKDLSDFYENTYFQKNEFYSKVYKAEELEYMNNQADQKKEIVKRFLNKSNEKCVLDLGCGEGFVLNYFYQKGWEVTGIDFSIYGVEQHNKDIVNFILQGDLFEKINVLHQKKKTFDFINADNFLEHINEPEKFFREVKKVCKKETIVCVKVPNDFSITQKNLFEKEHIQNTFWVTKDTSEHFSYFSKESLLKLAKANGFRCLMAIADYPIDMNLFNPDTNYSRLPEKGHNCYLAKIEIENMIYKESKEKTIHLHEVMADMGIGREIEVYLQQEV